MPDPQPAPTVAGSPTSSMPPALGVRPTPDDGTRLSRRRVWDESTRPTAPPAPAGDVQRGPARQRPGLAPVVDRLEQEHRVIHDVLEQVDAALVELVRRPGALGELQEAVDLLTDTLLSHLSYEERELVEPLARHGMW